LGAAGFGQPGLIVPGQRWIDNLARSLGDHLGTEPGVRGKLSVIAMAMDTGWRNEPPQALEQLEGRKDENAPPVGCRTG
jgi:hypothetical protein